MCSSTASAINTISRPDRHSITTIHVSSHVLPPLPGPDGVELLIVVSYVILAVATLIVGTVVGRTHDGRSVSVGSIRIQERGWNQGGILTSQLRMCRPILLIQ